MDSYVVLTSLSDGKYIIIQGRIGSVDSNLVEDRGVESGSCLAQNNLEGLGIVGGSSTGGDANVVVLACLELDRHGDEVVVSIVGFAVGIVSAIGSTPRPSIAIAVGIDDIEDIEDALLGEVSHVRHSEGRREEDGYLVAHLAGTKCVSSLDTIGVVTDGEVFSLVDIGHSHARSNLGTGSLDMDRLDASLSRRNSEDNLVSLTSPCASVTTKRVLTHVS